MTRVIRKTMYCPNCNKKVEVPVVLSTSSIMLEKDKNLKEKFESGTAFKNLCPICNNELKDKE